GLPRAANDLFTQRREANVELSLHVAGSVGNSGCHLAFGAGSRSAGPQADDAGVVETAYAAELCPVEAHRLEDFGVLGELVQWAEFVAGRKMEIGRKNANDDVGFAIDLNRLADDLRICPEAAPPERVGEDGELVCAGAILALVNRALEAGVNTENGEKLPGAGSPFDHLWLAIAGEIE